MAEPQVLMELSRVNLGYEIDEIVFSYFSYSNLFDVHINPPMQIIWMLKFTGVLG